MILAAIWIVLGAFVGFIAVIPLRMALHHLLRREWEAGIANLIIGLMLSAIALAQFAYAAKKLGHTGM